MSRLIAKLNSNTVNFAVLQKEKSTTGCNTIILLNSQQYFPLIYIVRLIIQKNTTLKQHTDRQSDYFA